MENNWKEKIDEILDYLYNHGNSIELFSRTDVKETMLEVMDLVFEATKKKCADKARFNLLKDDKIITELLTHSSSEDNYWFNMNKESILNINKPNL